MPVNPFAARCAAALATLLLLSSAVRGQVSIVERDTSAADRIEAALTERVSFTFSEEPLKDAIDAIQQRTGLPIVVATKKLEEAAIHLDSPVNLSMREVALESFFRHLLEEREMAILIRDEALVITTKDDARSNLTTRTYPVLDLVSYTVTSNNGSRTTVTDYDSLIEVITTTLDPDSWDDVGGPGSIAEFVNAGALVTSQTRENHQRIATLLNSLRRAKVVQGISTIQPLATTSSPTRSPDGRQNLKGGLFSAESAPPLVRRRVVAPQSSWQLPQVYEE
ncbi:MAG: hypothetical protein K8R36_21265 [Planctomycetales bacterium]|nr:hypothetical protein [Planctomycetales bacterium]